MTMKHSLRPGRAEEAHQWRERIESGQASRQERQAFERWLSDDRANQHAYDRAKTLWRALGTIKANDYDPALYRPSFRERFFNIIDGATGLLTRYRLRFAGAAFVVSALALSLIMPGLGAFRAVQPVMRLQQAQYSTAVGQVDTITLGDGSKVTLGPDSRLDVAFSSAKRRLVLSSGAAYFDVRSDKDRPFVVQAGAMTAQALGTVFDVRFNAGIGRVAVAEGTVRVAMPSLIDGRDVGLKRQADLLAGQQVTTTRGDGLRAAIPIDPQVVGAWRESRLSYVGGTLEELVTDAARYSGRDIALDTDISALEVTIAYDAEDIDALLRTLSKVLPISVKQGVDKSILISARDPG